MNNLVITLLVCGMCFTAYPEYHPDPPYPELRRYTQDNKNQNAIKLEFRDGRKGRFEVQRGRYILEVESEE